MLIVTTVLLTAVLGGFASQSGFSDGVGVEAVVQEQGLDPADLDDGEVRELQEQGRELLPDEAAAQREASR